jgi:Ca2+-binding RTX toxin-like protein
MLGLAADDGERERSLASVGVAFKRGLIIHRKETEMPTSSKTAINPADFVSVIDNPYFPLQPGTTFVYQNPGKDAFDTMIVTHDTKVIDGVTCTLVHDVAHENGQVIEDTFDYYAQDKQGNVWYFGEDTKELEDGKVVTTEGTWRAGVNGAEPGIIMEAHPHVGDAYKQEHAPGVAEDAAQVTGLHASADVPYGTFSGLLDTKEFTPLEPGVVEHKLYGLGIGMIDGIENTGDFEHLVKIIFDGTAGADTIEGKAGKDELNGFAGNDHLNGGAGSDVVKGGRGDDVIRGGNDHDADILYGNQGRDHLYLRADDKGYGGSGNDTITLLDTGSFGLVSGGEGSTNLANSRGDVLTFEGELDLAHKHSGGRVSGIETIAMHGAGEDKLTLSVHDVLDLGSGTFDPKLSGPDKLGAGNAVRIDGGHGDEVTLTGGKWHEIAATNAPAGYDVYARQTGSGEAYALVQEDVHVHLTHSQG